MPVILITALPYNHLEDEALYVRRRTPHQKAFRKCNAS